MTLKNTPYPHQRYALYNTLVNEEKQASFISIRRIYQEDTTYLLYAMKTRFLVKDLSPQLLKRWNSLRVTTQAGSESRPPMLNKENYMPWSSRLLRYAKSRPNGKLIHNSIINGPYVRRMTPEPGDTNREVPVNETFHVQTDDELTEKELK
nr:hypothetical protein [Tanacetum cinerariifolium]